MSWARHATAGPNGTMTSSGRKSDVHVGGFSLDNGPDVVIASPEPLYLDYDSDIIPATPEPCSRVIVPTSRIPQQAHVPSERIPSQLNFLVYNSERYNDEDHRSGVLVGESLTCLGEPSRIGSTLKVPGRDFPLQRKRFLEAKEKKLIRLVAAINPLRTNRLIYRRRRTMRKGPAV
ncbi:hypothetical protein J6590_001816 [Homalodisca vitripennis]|nr:hypothetical protein J6590_001816 [Homalodisca vitripennis]